MKLFSIFILHIVFWAVCSTSAHGQVVESVLLNDARGGKTDLMYRMPSLRASAPGLSVLPFHTGYYYNSDRSWGPNMGPVWLGKGYSQSLSGGLRLNTKYLDIQVRPVLLSSENRYFTQAKDFNRYTDPEIFIYDHIEGDIDAPLRIDDQAFSKLYGGDTWAKVKFWKLAGGVSSESLWWGPSKRGSLLLSNNAPGIWHATIHTTSPINLYIMDVETQMLAGFLEPSESLQDYRRDYRIIFNGLNISFAPAFDKNLKIGLIRTFILNENDILTNRGYLPLFQPFLKNSLSLRSDGTTNDPDDQRASVYFSWAFPRANFHFYGELARDDHNADLRDLYLHPNHMRAFTIGAQKRWSNSQGLWSYTAEVTNLESTNTRVVRFGQTFYTHTRVERGYTHYGQYLGSHYGQGGAGFFSSLFRTKGNWTSGLLFERVARNKEFYRRLKYHRKDSQPEIEFVFGAQTWYRGNRVDVGFEMNVVATQNRFALGLRPEGGTGRNNYHPRNLNLQLTIAYRPDWRILR